MANPEIIVRYLADTKALTDSADNLGRSTSSAGRLAGKAFLPAVATLGAIGVAANKAVDAASALNEQVSASSIVFGQHAKDVQEWSKTGAEAFGLSAKESLSAANAYGNMFNTVGLGEKDVSKMSKSMVQLAGDMASFHDQDPTEMLDKLRSGLSGEAEPLRRFGVLISEASVNTFAYQNGIAKVGEKLTEAQKVQARYGVIMEQSSSAQGDFARTSDSVANRQRTLAAQTENLSASLGQVLLPVTELLLGALSKLTDIMAGNERAVQIAIGAIAAMATVIIGVNVAVKAWAAIQMIARAATLVWTAAQWLLNAALTANPIGLVVVAIGILVAALIVAYTKSETFRDIVKGALNVVLGVVQNLKAAFDALKLAAEAGFNWIKDHWKLALFAFGPIGAAVYLIATNFDKVKAAAQAVADVIKGIVGVVKDLIDVVKDLIGWLGKIKVPKIPGVPGGLPDLNPFMVTPPNIPPSIPRFARGGIVHGPTVALLGEGGPEAVIPLGASGQGGIEVRVFIGDTELKGLVRTEVRSENTRTASVLLAGAR